MHIRASGIYDTPTGMPSYASRGALSDSRVNGRRSRRRVDGRMGSGFESCGLIYLTTIIAIPHCFSGVPTCLIKR
jgi:hypothetical protein